VIFGDPSTFAIEAITEPGPEFSATVGRNITGRFRFILGELEVGNFNEPNCVLRSVSQHLVVLCASAASLWHSSLAGKSAIGWFNLLNESIYLSGEPEPNDAYHRMNFLTNESEALNNVKGFLVSPPDEPLHVLLKLPNSEVVHHRVLTQGRFCSVSSQFAAWVAAQEHELLRGGA
jgi:hypothetical protein